MEDRKNKPLDVEIRFVNYNEDLHKVYKFEIIKVTFIIDLRKQ